MPPGGANGWLPTVSATAGVEIPTTSIGGVIPTVPLLGGTDAVFPTVPLLASSGIGEGLIPVREKISKKILQLEFMDMSPISWYGARVDGMFNCNHRGSEVTLENDWQPREGQGGLEKICFAHNQPERC